MPIIRTTRFMLFTHLLYFSLRWVKWVSELHFEYMCVSASACAWIFLSPSLSSYVCACSFLRYFPNLNFMCSTFFIQTTNERSVEHGWSYNSIPKIFLLIFCFPLNFFNVLLGWFFLSFYFHCVCVCGSALAYSLVVGVATKKKKIFVCG